MKRTVFFTEPDWAFGVIHYELVKRLYEHGVDAQVLSWNRGYTVAEIQELGQVIDQFVSTPYGVAQLIDRYGIAPERCVAVVHAVLDIECLRTFLPDNVRRLQAYGAVSEWLVDQSQALGIERIPDLVPIGINTASFGVAPSRSLRRVGYAGAINPDNIHRHIKRPWLVEQAVAAAGLEFVAAHAYHNSWVTMPGFYAAVDAVIVSSTEEGAGLPALEASAAGRLVISTPVGLWLTRSGGTGHTVPINETEFLRETTELLKFYAGNPEAYQAQCAKTQQHSAVYDWGQVIDAWRRILQ